MRAQRNGWIPNAGSLATQEAAALRLWAKVEYDGTDFSGFQIQAQGRTVQGEIERALEVITETAIRVTGAGRTDRGVHARGQVIGFEVAWQHGLSDLQRALNAVLAVDVAIPSIGHAPDGFHPRFSAVRRTYRYTLSIRSWRSPLERRYAWHVAHKLDLALVTRASRFLLGTHDFATFGRPPQGANTVRTVTRAEWQERGPFLTVDIEGNAFLYRMVRSIVGMLVLVGSGQVSLEGFEEILQARDRSRIKQVAPAHGLCLMHVDYETRDYTTQPVIRTMDLSRSASALSGRKELCSEDVFGNDSGN